MTEPTFTRHDGGACPVPHGTPVLTDSGIVGLAESLTWRHDAFGDDEAEGRLVGYRVLHPDAALALGVGALVLHSAGV